MSPYKCECGHTEAEHMSPDRTDRTCERTGCTCWNYTCVRTDDDTNAQETPQALQQALECDAAKVYQVETDNLVKTHAQSDDDTQQQDDKGVNGSSIKDFPLMSIDSIKIGNRFRKNLGDIDSLAKDINEIDLLQPIVVNENHELISGVRRIEAFKVLGKSEIPARIVNLDDIVKGEISKNTQRKDFSWEEIILIKKAVEPEIKKESAQRKLSGKPSAKFAEGSKNRINDNATSKNYSENQTRAKVAKYVSLHGKEISHPTLATAEKVYDVAQKEPTTFGQIWEDLNSEKISPHKVFKKVQKIQIRQKFLAETPAILPPDGLKLIEGDFVEKSLEIADKCVDLIFTDPPYDFKSLTLFQELGKVAWRVLKDGGSLVTYCGQDYKYQIQQFMQSSGLTPRWELAVILSSGPHARISNKQVLVTWKPLLWFVKGPEKRTPHFIEDSVVSTIPPAKELHEWEQSTTEASHVISKLTFPNDVVLDCFMGIGTTGIVAHDLKRQFIGIEKDAEVFQIARRNISARLADNMEKV